MSSNKENSNSGKVTLKPLLIPAIISCVLFAYFLFFEKQSDFSLQNSGLYTLNTYSDSTKGGDTRILSFKKSTKNIAFKYKIGHNEINYAGFSYLINDSVKSILDQFNSVRIDYETNNIGSFGFIGKTFEEGITINGDDQSHRVNYVIINPSKNNNKESATFRYDDFLVRDWWKSQYAKGKTIAEEPNWNSTLMFSLIEESNLDNTKPSTISIQDVVFQKDHSEFYLLSLYLVTISFLPFLISNFVRNNKEKSKEVVITYKSLEVKDEESDNWEEQLFEFIGKEYPNSELKLLHLSKHLAKSERAISAVIHKKLNLTFKQYLNSIRIKEAKKLLSETNLSIKEITYAVGYSSPNNFRRVFKQTEGVSASEFREKI